MVHLFESRGNQLKILQTVESWPAIAVTLMVLVKKVRYRDQKR